MTPLENQLREMPMAELCKQAQALANELDHTPKTKRKPSQYADLALHHRIIEERCPQVRDTMVRWSYGNQPLNTYTQILVGAVPQRMKA